MRLDPTSPIIIGGVGGSGTRVVTQMLIDLGYYMGTENNSAHDSLWFRFFLKRPDWFHDCEENHPEDIHRALGLMQSNLTGPFRPSIDDLRFIRGAMGEQGWRGFKRAVKLFKPRTLDYETFQGWGWKEPSTHIFLDHLNNHFSGMKYIHTIRHGLDMAYTGKLSQIRDWASRFSIPEQQSRDDQAAILLDFWIQANRRAMEWKERMGPDRFYLLNFDTLCDHPREEISKLTDFLGRTVDRPLLDALAAIPRIPSSRNRYQAHDWKHFGAERLSAVQDMGFSITEPADPDSETHSV